jgi:hypothetical protein
VVTTRPSTPELWERVSATQWMDAARLYQVGGEGAPPANAVVIAADSAVPPGRYTRAGNRVSASAAVVQSVAARYIAGDLERTAGPNGSR